MSTKLWFAGCLPALGLALMLGCASHDDGPHPVLCEQYCQNPTTLEVIDVVTIEAFSREEAAQTCIAQQWRCSIPNGVRSCDCDVEDMEGRSTLDSGSEPAGSAHSSR